MSARGTSSRSLWRNHDFMILWTSETVSSLGTSMSFFVFPLIGYTLSGSTVEAALAGSAFTLGNVVSRLPAGALVDRWNRRAVLLGSQVAGALLYASLAAALLVGRLTLVHLVTVALVTGVIGTFFQPAETAAVRTVVPRDQLPTAFSQNQARRHVAALVGPPIGGALYAVARWAPFLLDACTFALSALAITRVRTALPAPEREPGLAPSMRGEIGEGLRFLWSRGFFRALLGWASLANFASDALFLVVVLKLLQAGVPAAAIGVIETIAAVAGIAGAVAAPWLIRRVPSGLLTIGTGVLLGVAVAPMAFTNNPVLIGVLFAVALFGNPAGNAAISSYMTAVTPDRLQGRAGAALNFGATLFTPLGPLLGGALIAVLGGRDAMLVTAGLTAVSVVPLLLSREVRQLSTPDRWPDEVRLERVAILEA